MTYAYIAIAAATALTAASSIRQGQAAQAQADYAAAQGEEDAKQAAQQTSTMEDEQRARARKVIGAQIAAQSQSGAQLSGSAADLLRESLFNAEADAQQIRYEGKTRTQGLLSQASASRLSGKSARQQGSLSAVSALAQGAAAGYGRASAPKAAPAGSLKGG